MNPRHSQKLLKVLLSAKETASTIVAVPAGTQPSSVITANYDAGLSAPMVSNRAGLVGMLSPLDGSKQQPIEIETPIEDIPLVSLNKVGECTNCSNDLYADNATAEAMHEHAHLGACIMCGNPVSYANSGELARIATSVKEPLEVANQFDFGDLLTVDPNQIKEIDMSNSSARKLLRESVASVMRTISASEQADAEDTVDSDEEDTEDEAEDFAGESDDASQLDTMDMDENDPPRDDGEDTDTPEDDETDGTEDISDEQEQDDDGASQEAAAVETADEEDTDSADAVADGESDDEEEADEDTEDCDDESDEDDTEEATVKVETTETADELVVAETPVVETPVVEAPANETETVLASDDTIIEYQATTPADLSPDADLVAVSETAYYLVQNGAPVAVLRKEQASAGAQSLWHKPYEMKNVYRASLAGNREIALAELGGTILRQSTTVASVIAERITASETASATELATARAATATKMKQCLEIASLGITKGMFGPKFANPVASELTTALAGSGVHEPQAIVRACMIQAMPNLIEKVIEKAMELADQSEDALAVQAEMVGNSEFIAPVATTVEAPAVVETPAAIIPAIIKPLEMASLRPSAKPKVDVGLLTRGLGRLTHA